MFQRRDPTQGLRQPYAHREATVECAWASRSHNMLRMGEFVAPLTPERPGGLGEGPASIGLNGGIS